MDSILSLIKDINSIKALPIKIHFVPKRKETYFSSFARVLILLEVFYTPEKKEVTKRSMHFISLVHLRAY